MSHSQLPPVLNVLNTLEKAVVDAARQGTWAQPDTALAAEQLTTNKDPKLRVRAELIRELLMGRRGELDPRGVLLRSVQVIGQLDLDHVTAVTCLTLVNCALPDGITCRRALLHAVSLFGSVISTVEATGVRTDGHFSLEAADITGASEAGAIRLLGAHIGGQLDLGGIIITNPTGTALMADDLHTDGRFSLAAADITGASEAGAIRLLGAHIGGQLDLDGITITNPTGTALDADRIRTDSYLFLRDAHITGTTERGAALWLLGAHIGGQLDLDRATITNTSGTALHADGIRVEDGLFLRDAHITGAGEEGALRLLGAHIGSQTNLTGTQVINKSGWLLVFAEAKVDETLFVSAALVCPRSRREVGDLPCPDGARRMDVAGFVFTQLHDVSWREWLHLLVHHTPVYLPQPYQQLAAVERAAGHDNNARAILITQQDDLRRRTPDALGGTLARARHWLWGWLGRYGYRAHRLVTALLIVLVFAGATGYTAGQITTRPHHRTAERVQPPTTPATAPGVPCSTAELIGLGIDRGLPVGATGLRARCDLDTATRWGQAFTYLLWALQALLWGLATLTIAAYTGLIRKTT